MDAGVEATTLCAAGGRESAITLACKCSLGVAPVSHPPCGASCGLRAAAVHAIASGRTRVAVIATVLEGRAKVLPLPWVVVAAAPSVGASAAVVEVAARVVTPVGFLPDRPASPHYCLSGCDAMCSRREVWTHLARS